MSNEEKLEYYSYNKILSKNTEKNIKQIENDTDRDHFLTSQEALDYGIIDKIIKKKER